MARVSKPAVVADKPAARRVSRARKSMRSSRHPPESGADTMETTESRVATAIAPPPEIETAALEAAALETLEEAMIEPPAAAMPPVESDQAAAEVPEPPEPIVAPGEPAALFAPSEPALPAAPAQAEPSGATISFAVPALGEIQRLQGIGLSFWQDQLKRTMATGQAIMVCRSPQAVIGLQMAYVQATLASGFEHASQLTRLSQDLVRNLSSSRPR
jgi:hypothetical protein